MRSGIFSAVLAFLCWGLFPIYFKALNDVPALELLTHRVLWSLLFLALVLAWRKQWAWLGAVVRKPKVVAGFIASALLLSCNWLVYIVAVHLDRVVDASLGYFMLPLVNVALGFLFLKERLRRMQWVAIAVATCGVLWLTWSAGQLPWIGLLLAGSFGLYGLLRKTASLGALEGLSFETVVLLPLALAYQLWLMHNGTNTFTHQSSLNQWLLIAAGPITAIPLLLFASAARRLPLSMLGLLQYLTPTIQLLLGVWLYNEPFRARLLGFVLIWSALALYSLEGWWRARRGISN